MILVSFSSGEDALFKDVKNILLDRMVLKIRRSDFLGHPVYRVLNIKDNIRLPFWDRLVDENDWNWTIRRIYKMVIM